MNALPTNTWMPIAATKWYWNFPLSLPFGFGKVTHIQTDRKMYKNKKKKKNKLFVSVFKAQTNTWDKCMYPGKIKKYTKKINENKWEKKQTLKLKIETKTKIKKRKKRKYFKKNYR